jgi:hypothetical protein
LLFQSSEGIDRKKIEGALKDCAATTATAAGDNSAALERELNQFG